MRVLKLLLILVFLGLLSVGGFLGYAYYATQQGIETYARQVEALSAKSKGQLQFQYSAHPIWYRPGVVALSAMQASFSGAQQGIIATATHPDAEVKFNLWNPQAPVILTGQSGPFSLRISGTAAISETADVYLDLSGTLGGWRTQWVPTAEGGMSDTQFEMQNITIDRVHLSESKPAHNVNISIAGVSLNSPNPMAKYSQVQAQGVVRQLAISFTSTTQTVRMAADDFGFTVQPFIAGTKEGKTEYFANGLTFQAPDLAHFKIDRVAFTNLIALSAAATSPSTVTFKNAFSVGPIKSLSDDKPVPLESLSCSMAVEGLPLSVVQTLQELVDATYTPDSTPNSTPGSIAEQPEGTFTTAQIRQAFSVLRTLLATPLSLAIEDCGARGMGATGEVNLRVNLQPGRIESVSGSASLTTENIMVLGMMGGMMETYAPGFISGTLPLSPTLRFAVGSEDGILTLNASPTVLLPLWDVAQLQAQLDATEERMVQNPAAFEEMIKSGESLFSLPLMINPDEEVSGTLPPLAVTVSETSAPRFRTEPNREPTPSMVFADEKTLPTPAPEPDPTPAPTPKPKAKLEVKTTPKAKPKTAAPEDWIVPGIEDSSAP